MNTQFDALIKAVKKHGADIIHNDMGYAFGEILGFKFRIYSELNNGENGTDDKYQAFLCIGDETARPGAWPAFYNASEVDEWAAKHKP